MVLQHHREVPTIRKGLNWITDKMLSVQSVLLPGQKRGSSSDALLSVWISPRRAAASHDIKLRSLYGKLPFPTPTCSMLWCCALGLIETQVAVVVVVLLMTGPQRKSWPGHDSWWMLRRRTASRRCIWLPSTTTATWPRSSSKRWGEIL